MRHCVRGPIPGYRAVRGREAVERVQPQTAHGWERFALDPTPAQVRMLESHCGAARFAFNHMLAAVKANMGQRQAERSYGIADHELTPTQGWSLAALRKTWNQHKNG